MAIYRLWNDMPEIITKPHHATKSLKVILDSNALFVPFQFNIDIFEALEELLGRRTVPIVLSPIKKELETIAEKSSPKMRKSALCALKIAEKCKFLEAKFRTSSSPDDAIVEMSKGGGYIVFTNDRQLRKRLRDISVPVIYVRQKAYLEIDGRV
jgi:rRNA-processing protein FCF1